MYENIIIILLRLFIRKKKKYHTNKSDVLFIEFVYTKIIIWKAIIIDMVIKNSYVSLFDFMDNFYCYEKIPQHFPNMVQRDRYNVYSGRIIANEAGG